MLIQSSFLKSYCLQLVQKYLTNLCLPRRYQPIWTIYIPLHWKPSTHRFQKYKNNLKFWRYIMPYSTTQHQLVPVLSRSIAAYEQRHIRRTIQPEVFPNLLVHQSICNIFSTHCTVHHLFMTQSSWANLDYITFEVLRCD